ncbi:hypothetical protein THRCLA_10016 [Thraustotheca clavata]|uniref:Transmembrane protein 135 N-terminal domain-containing protein n=1 Tax=Thraustotheca clavata TaxID=74557 RepID=A0A1V9YT61_9STRA|nr:hypothetical protein THRCLA_10016 [Thraustotheca clavata]
MVSIESAVAGAKGAGSCLALGIAIASVRKRQLRPPSELFTALATGCGIFRTLEPTSKRTAACLASIAFFRLITDSHKHIVLSYALVELALQVYELFPPSKAVEHATSIAVTGRLMHTFMVNWEWILPSQLKMLDNQSCISPDILATTRAVFRSDMGSRCEAFHPNQSCGAFLRDKILAHIKNGAKIFFPIHLVAVLLAWKNNRLNLSKQGLDYVRSIFFLLGNYVFPYTFSCMVPIKSHRLTVLLGSITPYFAQLIEPPKRRFTIRKAVASYSLVTVFYQLKEYICFSKFSRQQVVSMATVMYATCMIYLLEHPERQNRWLMYGLYGYDIQIAKVKSEQKSISNEAQDIPSQMN